MLPAKHVSHTFATFALVILSIGLLALRVSVVFFVSGHSHDVTSIAFRVSVQLPFSNYLQVCDNLYYLF